MRHSLIICALFGLLNTGYGQEASDERLGHLLEAAEHLIAAGEAEQALIVQKLVASECRKLAVRLKNPESEVAGRQPQLGQTTILIELKLVELSRTKLRALGLDLDMLRDGDLQLVGCETARFQVVDGEPLILNLLEALTKNKVAKMQLAKTLANPTLVTVSGRPASFRVGGEVPAVVAEPGGYCRVEKREIGLRVDVVAVTRNNGKIRLELRPCISELDAAKSLPGHPIIKSRSMDTEVELAQDKRSS